MVLSSFGKSLKDQMAMTINAHKEGTKEKITRKTRTAIHSYQSLNPYQGLKLVFKYLDLPEI